MIEAHGSREIAQPRWRVRTVAGIAALILCVGGLAIARGGGDAKEFVAADPVAGYTMPLDGSERTFTLSSLYISRPGSELQVLEVQALTSPNVDYLGAVNIWPRDLATNALSVGPGYPAPEIKVHHPIDEVVPAAETDVPALPGVASQPPLALALGFRLTSGDLGAVNGVRVVYRANGRTAEETFRHALIVCTKPRLCEPAKGESESEYNDRVLSQFGLLPPQA